MIPRSLLRRRTVVACLVLLSLAACERRPARDTGADSDSAAVPSDSAHLAAAARRGTIVTEWVALGNEPFWNVSVMPDSIVWRTPDQLAGVRFPPAAAEKLDGRRVWQTSRSGTPASLELAIQRATCSDGMSDRVYPYEAKVRLDTLSFAGCAEERAVWIDEAAGFAFRIPPAWDAEWDAAIYEGAEAASRSSGGRTVVEFACRPVKLGPRPEVLLAVVVLDRVRWDALRAEAGPPPGELLDQQGDRVWVAGLPQSQPFAAGSADARRFEAMQLSIAQVKHAFSLLRARR